MKPILIACIYAYKYTLSALVGAECRFIPTCSDYAIEAIRIHPTHKALKLILKRLIKCRPKGAHGFDPVPNSPLDKKIPDNIKSK